MSMFHDISCLEHIIFHCQRLEDIRKEFGDSVEQLTLNLTYKDAVDANIMQIGENIGELTDEFKQEHDIIPWNNVKGFRNVVVHRYLTIKWEVVYDAIVKEIPAIKKYCEEQL